MTPVEGCGQRLMALRATRPSGEQAKSVVEKREHLGGREMRNAGCGKLDGQRVTVQTPTYVSDRRPVGVVDGKPSSGLGGAIGEETHTLSVDLERRDYVHLLAEDAERFPARREQTTRARPGDDHLGERGASADDVFAVVEDAQDRSV